jgi:hypothetical protein
VGFDDVRDPGRRPVLFVAELRILVNLAAELGERAAEVVHGAIDTTAIDGHGA